MSSIHVATLKRALAMLDAIGATYKVVYDGQVTTTLPEAPARKLKRSPRHSFAQTGYIAAIGSMAKGDTLTFKANGVPPEAFRAAIAAQGVTKFGRHSCITHVNKAAKTIEILRVE